MKSLRFLLLAMLMPSAALAGELTVVEVGITDYKPVFATIESVHVANARARIGGTVVDLKVEEGSQVKQGEVVAVIGDDKLALQLGSLDAQTAAAQAQQAKARDDYNRAQELFKNGTIAKARLDEAKAAFQVADNQLKSAIAQRSVTDQQVKEGQVLAPADGRVLEVPVTKGSVIMPGEVAARIAADTYILRLQLPERHAAALKVGESIKLEDGRTGTLRKIYPEISGGRVQADADVPELGSYFVGQRVRVLVSTGQHQGIVIPSNFIMTRAGIDYVRLKQDGTTFEVPVQRGEVQPSGIEILSGLKVGDVLIGAE